MIVDSHRAGGGRGGRGHRRRPHRARPRRRQRRSRCRLDQFRRDRSPRARSAAQSGAALGAAGGDDGRAAGEDIAPSTGVMLALAFPDRVARNRGNGSFVLANGRGAAVEQTSSLARAPIIAVAELTGTAAQGRILLAAPIAQADIERASPTRSRQRRNFLRSRRDGAAWRGASGRCTRSRCRKQPLALSPSAETARIFADGIGRRRARPVAVVETAEAMARPRDVPAQGGGR